MVSCGNAIFRSYQQNLCEDRRVQCFLAASTDNTDVLQNIRAGNIIYPIPDNLFEHAAAIEPVSVAVHAVNRTP